MFTVKSSSPFFLPSTFSSSPTNKTRLWKPAPRSHSTSLQCHKMLVPGLGEVSPEAKAANHLHDFFTYVAVKIVTSQLQSYNEEAYADLMQFVDHHSLEDGDKFCAELMRKNRLLPMLVLQVKADVVEVIIQAPTSVEKLKIKCCFDYMKLSYIYLDDMNDMEQINVELMTKDEHVFTTPNLVVIKMIEIEEYKVTLYVFDPGASRQFLFVLDYVEYMKSGYSSAIIMEFLYDGKARFFFSDFCQGLEERTETPIAVDPVVPEEKKFDDEGFSVCSKATEKVIFTLPNSHSVIESLSELVTVESGSIKLVSSVEAFESIVKPKMFKKRTMHKDVELLEQGGQILERMDKQDSVGVAIIKLARNYENITENELGPWKEEEKIQDKLRKLYHTNKQGVRVACYFNVPKSMGAFYLESSGIGSNQLPLHNMLSYGGSDGRKMNITLRKPAGKNLNSSIFGESSSTKSFSHFRQMIEYCEQSICRKKRILEICGKKLTSTTTLRWRNESSRICISSASDFNDKKFTEFGNYDDEASLFEEEMSATESSKASEGFIRKGVLQCSRQLYIVVEYFERAVSFSSSDDRDVITLLDSLSEGCSCRGCFPPSLPDKSFLRSQVMQKQDIVEQRRIKLEKLFEFGQQLTNALNQAEFVVKGQRDMAKIMREMGLVFIKLTRFENEQARLNTQRVRAAGMKQVSIKGDHVTFQTLFYGLCSVGRTGNGIKIFAVIFINVKVAYICYINLFSFILYGLYKGSHPDHTLEFRLSKQGSMKEAVEKLDREGYETYGLVQIDWTSTYNPNVSACMKKNRGDIEKISGITERDMKTFGKEKSDVVISVPKQDLSVVGVEGGIYFEVGGSKSPTKETSGVGCKVAMCAMLDILKVEEKMKHLEQNLLVLQYENKQLIARLEQSNKLSFERQSTITMLEKEVVNQAVLISDTTEEKMRIIYQSKSGKLLSLHQPGANSMKMDAIRTLVRSIKINSKRETLLQRKKFDPGDPILLKGLNYSQSESMVDSLAGAPLSCCQLQKIKGTLCVSWSDFSVLQLQSKLKDHQFWTLALLNFSPTNYRTKQMRIQGHHYPDTDPWGQGSKNGGGIVMNLPESLNWGKRSKRSSRLAREAVQSG